MKFYDHVRRLSRSNALLVAFLTVVITFAIIFPSSAQFQPETSGQAFVENDAHG